MSVYSLLRALGVQRIQAMGYHQSVNLLKMCLVSSSAASTFYWSIIHNRNSDVKITLVNKLNLVNNSTYQIALKNSRRLFYNNGNVVVVRLEHSHSFNDSLDNHSTASGPAWCIRCRPPGNAVSGHSSTMCLVVWWLSPQGQAGDAITPHR